MVALVRAGVTATCSGADKPRYGDLDVDSNLPDTRIALGGPDQNAFTAAVLAEADPVYAEELKRQLDATGAARVWVPAIAPLADEWVPGADLRRVRALPVLVIAGRISTRGRLGVEDLADAEIVVEQGAPAGLEPFEARTVAVLNRGMPGFAVDSDGTLHTVADAVVHRLAVGHLDRPAAAHRARRVQFSAAALDAHLRVRGGLRRR